MGNTIIGRDVVQYDNGPAERIMTLNTDPSRICDWCEGEHVAAVIVTDGGWDNRACVMHALRWYPELWPAAKRPAQYGNAFMMTTVTGRGAYAALDDWETFDRSDTLLSESRFLHGNDEWTLMYRSSTRHYRATGHFRMAYENAIGVRIAIHAVVK